MRNTETQTERQQMYCGDRNRGCGASLTEADVEAGRCTQCGLSLMPDPLPLQHALLLSLTQAQGQRVITTN